MVSSPPSEAVASSSQALSPVSPKPLRFPHPSSIGVLENQMDPVLNDTSTYMSDANISDVHAKSQQQLTASQTMQIKTQNDTTTDGVDEKHDAQAAAGSDTDHGMSVDSNNSVALDNHTTSAISSHAQHNETSDHAPNHTSDVAYESIEQGSAPTPESDLYEDDSDATPAVTSKNATAPSNPSQNPQSQPHELATTSTTSSEAVDPSNLQSFLENYMSGKDTGGVNFQALLENISSSVPISTQPGLEIPPAATSSDRAGSPDTLLTSTAPNGGKSPAPLPLGVANLPPRPPPIENALNSPLETDIRSYHLHDQPSFTVKNAPPHLGTNLRPPGNVPPPMVTAGAPGTALGANGLPPPPLATFQQHPSSTSQNLQNNPSTPTTYRQRDTPDRHDSAEAKLNDDEEIQWGADVQKQYEEFLAAERSYVTQGEWEKFPPNSRLFIGNLPSEKVTKRDIYYVFHKHGKLAQISIKQAYGFVQYLDSQACSNALEVEQGVAIRGRKIHLEISKPQRNTKDKGNADGRGTRNRRSRSPDYARGGDKSSNQNRADRYRGAGNNGNNRQRDGGRGRDDYRPGRSPSPRARGRDSYRGKERSPDRYNGRRRSRSRSPYGRMRSPSPRRDFDDECPLPRRNPRDVPDIQIIAKDNPDRAFISHVEKSFDSRGVRCDVLILSARLSEAAVVRRQIIEGVQAVMKLDRVSQMTQLFNLSVFNRSAGDDNVSFEEYTGQQLNICVELVLRAKTQARAAAAAVPQFNAAAFAATQYGLPVVQPSQAQTPQSYQRQQQQQQRQPAVVPPPSFPPLDASSLQQLLGRVQQQTPSTPTNQGQLPPPPFPPHLFGAQQPGQPPMPSANDLSRLLASANAASQQQQVHNPYAQQSAATPQQANAAMNPNQFASLASNPAWAALLANAPRPGAAGLPQQHQQQQQHGSQQYGQGAQHAAAGQNQGQGAPDMSSIMAQLAKYGQ